MTRQHDSGSLIVEALEIRSGKSPLILGDLDPSPPSAHTRRVTPTPRSAANNGHTPAVRHNSVMRG